MNPSFYLIAESEFDIFTVECGIIPGCLFQEKLKRLPCFWLNSDCRTKLDGYFFFGDGYKLKVLSVAPLLGVVIFSSVTVTNPGALVNSPSRTWSFLKLLYNGLKFLKSLKKMFLAVIFTIRLVYFQIFNLIELILQMPGE